MLECSCCFAIGFDITLMTKSHLPENWSYKLVDSGFGVENIGVRFRTARPGPEEDFICKFLGKLSCQGEPDLKLTIFKEPRIETGSPDLVGVIWHLPTAERWNANRLLLQRPDYRVMQYIFQTQSASLLTIKSLFKNQGMDSIDRLAAANMILIERNVVSTNSPSAQYAVRHIFAIEAKINAWRKALHQAFLNRWFACSSHVLLPQMPSSVTMISEARALGVRVWSPQVSKMTLNLPSAPSDPLSYVSWLFNDWAWKVWGHVSPTYAESKHTLMDQ